MSVAAPARVAVFGGSFDPPHVAHVLAVAWLLAAAPIEAVWVFPAADHAFGKNLTDFAQRLELSRRAFALFGAAVSVRDDEGRLAAGGRTLALIEHLHRQHPGVGMRLVLGTDQVQERHRWHRFDAIAALAPPLVLGRPGYAGDADLQPAITLPDVSSTAIRALLRRGESIAGLVPTAVAEAIAAEGLYPAERP